MVPDHMDDPFLDEDSDDEAAGTLGGNLQSTAEAAAGGDSTLPLRLGKHLQGATMQGAVLRSYMNEYLKQSLTSQI